MRYAGLRLRHVIIGMGFLFYVTNVQQLSAFSIFVMVIFLGLSFFLFGCYADDDMASVWLLIGAYLAVAIVITASAQSHKSMLFWAVLSFGFLDIYLEDAARWFAIVPCGMAASAALYYALPIPSTRASAIYFLGNYLTFVVLHMMLVRLEFPVLVLVASNFVCIFWFYITVFYFFNDPGHGYEALFLAGKSMGIWFAVCRGLQLPLFGKEMLGKEIFSDKRSK
ncbi:MAG: hypothetical protein AAF708_19080 [Deinococcota bacterium]